MYFNIEKSNACLSLGKYQINIRVQYCAKDPIACCPSDSIVKGGAVAIPKAETSTGHKLIMKGERQ